MVELYATSVTVLPGRARAAGTPSRGAGIPQALVSSSYRALVDSVLAHGFGPFALTLAGDEVVHGKPHPEPYLTAAAPARRRPARLRGAGGLPRGRAAAEAAGLRGRRRTERERGVVRAPAPGWRRQDDR